MIHLIPYNKLAINRQWIFKWNKMKVYMGKLKPINLQHLDKDVKRETFFTFTSSKSPEGICSWCTLYCSILSLIGLFLLNQYTLTMEWVFFCFFNHSLTTLQDQLIYNG